MLVKHTLCGWWPLKSVMLSWMQEEAPLWAITLVNYLKLSAECPGAQEHPLPGSMSLDLHSDQKSHGLWDGSRYPQQGCSGCCYNKC